MAGLTLKMAENTCSCRCMARIRGLRCGGHPMKRTGTMRRARRQPRRGSSHSSSRS